MIEIKNVSVILQGQPILQNISLQLSQKRIGVIGANGSGKSTFLRLLNGLQAPTQGAVNKDGLDSIKQGRELRRHVGFVFQNPDNQIVMPVVEEDLAFGLKSLKLDSQEIENRIDKVLRNYDMVELRKQSAHLLSGGQKQLLAICGVLIMEPQTIIFDEPTTMLDLRNRNRIAKLISALPQQIIMASHDLPLLEDFDRVLVFDQGRLICDDTPQTAIHFYQKLMQ